MLKGEALSFRYNSTQPWVLNDWSISVPRGSVVGLRGPSGRGKTTLALLLAGYLQPTTGRVTVDDQPIANTGASPVQLIFQHPELAINPRWRIGRVLTEGHSPSLELMGALSLDPRWLNRWPHELSGGELQRVAVARAIGTSTRYLIADEMTTMLDAVTQAQIWQAVLDHAQSNNLGVLVISHDASLLNRLCTDVIDLKAHGV